jgi:hypothetical protein
MPPSFSQRSVTGIRQGDKSFLLPFFKDEEPSFTKKFDTSLWQTLLDETARA